MATFSRPVLTPLVLLIAAAALPLQATAPQQRPAPDFTRFAAARSAARTVPTLIDEQDRVPLRGNVPGAVRSREATGLLEASLPMEKMILSLKLSPEAQARLDQLSTAQQDPKSPYFHQWLTPEQFGAMFGPSQEDIDAVAGWLLAQGFSIDSIAHGRLSITFSGSAAQVQRSFRTALKTFQVEGVLRHANADDPSIPAALSGVVNGVVSLTDIPRKAMNTGFKRISGPEEAFLPQPDGAHPDYTSSGGGHYIAPGDFATLYNLKPLYAAGIDGTGTTIAIVGRSNITIPDVTAFRTKYGLPVNDPTVILNGADPGTSNANELGEAMLDVEWSGAVAKNATIKFVVTKNTATTDGVDASAQYIVDNANTLGATVMSTSFGACETDMGAAENAFYNDLWQQAAAEGVTSFVSAGDAGAAGCNGGSDTTGSGAAVSGLASTPFNVCVGGTELNEGGAPATYWASTNGTDKSSALSYIPEIVWNESAGTTDPGGSAGSGLWSTGGGVSTVYAKPSWQVATGVPADAKRDCPDVSLPAASYDGYLVVQSGSTYIVGGTSASSPAFAGIMALIVQKTGSGQGNANPRFYQLGKAQYGSAGAAVFHDTKTGNNTVPGVTGFNAGTGYDLATGLGTVDANALVNNWAAASVTVSPATATVPINGTFAFKAASTLSPTTVTWSATAGSFSATTTPDGTTPTTYTAPATVGTVTITATGSGPSGAHGTATVTVYDPAQVAISVSPSPSATLLRLLPGSATPTLDLTATASLGSATWTTTGGTLSAASGLSTTLTPPASPADVTVTATSTLNAAKSSSVVVHVRSMDVNGDGVLDVRDLLAITGAYTTHSLAPDLDGGGTVDGGDITAFLNNF
ncbi:MAG TPA: protease pro-enzyme activation domain-containing protein [Holophagaceae bacterium]|nr:protease pro-enzyme activation domain-containing protein [Holophagaceae bacterium]